MGPLDQILGMLPNMGPLRGMNQMKVDEKELIHIEAIINSMTPGRTEQPPDSERQQKKANCPRQRAPGAGNQSAAEAICGNPENDEKPEQGNHAAHAAWHEVPADVIATSLSSKD